MLLVTVLGEIPDKQKAIREIYESLKPGGLLSITEVIADPHFQVRRKLMEIVGPSGFIVLDFFGNSLSYTINFEKPKCV